MAARAYEQRERGAIRDKHNLRCDVARLSVESGWIAGRPSGLADTSGRPDAGAIYRL
jgi:hypothetical protein